MQIIADLEVHSKYARAVSPQMDIPTISAWAEKKGIDLVGTGDFTHPIWLKEIQNNLVEAGEGIYMLKSDVGVKKPKARFLLTSEVSCIYSDKGKGKRVHILVYLPSLTDVTRFNKKLSLMGANLLSDGRPVVGLSLAQIAEAALTVNKKAILIPAHVWTPWFGFYGNMGGYDHLKDAFADLEKYIPGIETGLSSDPAMNWRISELTGKTIVSFGDAHSPQKLGREATVFEMPELSYENIRRAIWNGKSEEERGTDNKTGKTQNPGTAAYPHISYTIEFYPEEGKYHYTGHRKCEIVYSPEDVRKKGNVCPVCGRNLTLGVMGRVEQLSEKEQNDAEIRKEIDKFGVRWIRDAGGKHPPYVTLVPLAEIIAESLGVGTESKKVKEIYEQLILSLGSEYLILLKTPLGALIKFAGKKIAEAVEKVRKGDIIISPGYDGRFGTVRIWQDLDKTSMVSQDNLF